jgi:hypothetical protein
MFRQNKTPRLVDHKMKQDLLLTSPTSGFSAPEEEVTRFSSSFVS